MEHKVESKNNSQKFIGSDATKRRPLPSARPTMRHPLPSARPNNSQNIIGSDATKRHPLPSGRPNDSQKNIGSDALKRHPLPLRRPTAKVPTVASTAIPIKTWNETASTKSQTTKHSLDQEFMEDGQHMESSGRARKRPQVDMASLRDEESIKLAGKILFQVATEIPVKHHQSQPSPQPSPPQDTTSSRPRKQTAKLACNTNVAIQDLATTDTVERQMRQFSTATGSTLSLTLSKPAQSGDLEAIPWEERYLITRYQKTKQGRDDKEFMRWYFEIRRAFYSQLVTSFGRHIPASMFRGVLDELCRNHPCNKWPWTENNTYRDVLVIPPPGQQKGSANLRVLKDWMYGPDGTTTHATWRDTLITKAADDRKVPWVQREKLLAVTVFLEVNIAVHAESSQGVSRSRMRQKYDLIEECKLAYLLSDQDHVVANRYWDGFAEELEKDPEQESLYDKVMQEKHFPPVKRWY